MESESSNLPRWLSSPPKMDTSTTSPTLNHAYFLLSQANSQAPSLQAWKTIFNQKSTASKHLFASFRHRYKPSELYRLRHDRRAQVPIRSVAQPISYAEELPPFPFSSNDDSLTPDVLLSGSDSSLTFSDLLLSKDVISALAAIGLERPSPIQLRTLPRARLGSDIIAHSKSGTGKTFAYVLAIIDAYLTSMTSDPLSLSRSPSSSSSSSFSPHALVLTPTRELAVQVNTQFQSICSRLSSAKLNTAVLVGGVDENQNMQTLTQAKPIFIVGTPGRVLALVENGSLRLHAINMIVLDEADRLLHSAFSSDVREICSFLPDSRQTLAASATFYPWLRRLLLQIMNSPAYITCEVSSNVSDKAGLENERKDVGSHDDKAAVSEQQVHSEEDIDSMRKAVLLGVRQTKFNLNQLKSVPSKPNARKFRVLRELLNSCSFTLCIVFVNYRKDVPAIENFLKTTAVKCRSIYAGIKQVTRDEVMELVRNGKVKVLIATDLLARGVDLPTCDMVIHIGLPVDVPTYLHRVGRAGRFGGRGRSIAVYGSNDDILGVETLEQRLGFTIEEAKISFASSLKASTGDTNRVNKPDPEAPGGTSPNSAKEQKSPGLSPRERKNLRNRKSEEESVPVAKNNLVEETRLSAVPASDVPKSDRSRPVEEKNPNQHHINSTALPLLKFPRTELANDTTRKSGRKRTLEDDVAVETNAEPAAVHVSKKHRPGKANGDELPSYRKDNWENLAREADRKGFEEAYSRAFRMAYELCRKLHS